MSFQVGSVQEYFDTLERRFQADGAKGVKAIYQWDLGDDGTWHAIVNDGALEVHKGAHDAPTVVIRMSGDNYVKMANGKLNAQLAMVTGKMKVTGAIPMAMKMRNIFPQA